MTPAVLSNKANLNKTVKTHIQAHVQQIPISDLREQFQI